jgi:putative toxin-antitoxin system antitoxin component (TIGR02293 family)
MISLAEKQGSKVLLVGMQLPPNYGTAYASKFQALFANVARKKKVRLVPFLLSGIGTQLERFQADGLHPTAQAQPAVLDNVWRELEPMLKRAKPSSGRHLSAIRRYINGILRRTAMTTHTETIKPTPARTRRGGKATLFHAGTPASSDLTTEEPTLNLPYLLDEIGDNAADSLSAMKIIREGLPTSVIRRLEEAGVERKYRIQIIPERTLQHRVKNGERMTPAESERAYRMANIIALADRVFGNHDKGMRWLHSPMRRLEGQSPLDVLDTDIGARLVEEALGQIDAGYFA